MKIFTKLFTALLLTFASAQIASADIVKLKATADFSTANPPQYIYMSTVSKLRLSDTLYFPKNTVLTGELTNVTPPIPTKKNATFAYKLIGYTNINGDKIAVEGNYTFEYTTKPKFSADSIQLGVPLATLSEDDTTKVYNVTPAFLENMELSEKDLNSNTKTEEGVDITFSTGDVVYFKVDY